MLELMNIDERSQTELTQQLATVAVGLRELDPPVGDLTRLREQLLGSFRSLGGSATA
jgi:hypothetical protein